MVFPPRLKGCSVVDITQVACLVCARKEGFAYPEQSFDQASTTIIIEPERE
jgi:hypothetical protein